MRFSNLRSIFTRNASIAVQQLEIKEMSHKLCFDAIERMVENLCYERISLMCAAHL